jgi:hypothetical protein
MPAPYLGLFAPMKPPGALRPDHKPKPSWLAHLRVRWKRLDLDSELARGANPVKSEELALRAEQLAEPAMRARIATEIENIVRLATTGPGPSATTAMVHTSFIGYRVAANQPVLAALAGKLRARGPHALRGLAMASVLVGDADSPLYARSGVDTLEPAVRATISALDP